MTHRERFLTALSNQKPDRMPCQVHRWMEYYLQTYLGGIDQYDAYRRFGMGMVIYASPKYIYSESDLADWNTDCRDLGQDHDGNYLWETVITTPDGALSTRGARNLFTSWTTDYLIKNEADFELWNRYVPVPQSVDWAPVNMARERIGKEGIVRGSFFDFGQGSPWQSFCTLYNMQEAIMLAYDNPDWLHYALQSILDKKLAAIEHSGKMAFDLVETGGGAGSSTVISPSFHREFCLPYDKVQHQTLKQVGEVKTVYHLCGGIMPLLELVAENGADGLETMTPPAMGGDCNLAEATNRVGDRLFFIGGFDQNKGFENGSPKIIKEMVEELHAACPDGGYICSPSDHFFAGDPCNIQAFADTASKCFY